MAGTEREEYWQTKLDELTRTQLDDVRATAAKWQGTISTLLGVFGTAAFVAGPKTVDNLTSGEAQAAKLAVTAAVVLAALAVIAASYAAQGLPRKQRKPNFEWLESYSTLQAGKALIGLRASQVLALAATAVVLAGSLVVLWQSDPKPNTQSAVLVKLPDGTVRCGSLVNQQGRVAVKVSDRDTVLIDAGVQVEGTVSKCP